MAEEAGKRRGRRGGAELLRARDFPGAYDSEAIAVAQRREPPLVSCRHETVPFP